MLLLLTDVAAPDRCPNRPAARSDHTWVHLLKERVLLPGISVLVRLAGEVRRGESERLHALAPGRLSDDMHRAREGLPAVPEGKRCSELDREIDLGVAAVNLGQVEVLFPSSGLGQLTGGLTRKWPYSQPGYASSRQA
ncbi:hypothetical protein [Nonomuraea sp. JJY05]|uniref:hypothetical protein n=1 Tax=Nonomuraea sp. JJY05 TaxID=3350255 RepID=UPI00373E7F6F